VIEEEERRMMRHRKIQEPLGLGEGFLAYADKLGVAACLGKEFFQFIFSLLNWNNSK